MAEEDTDKVSDPEKSKSENLLNKCNHCEMIFNSEKGLKIHVSKSHKTESLQTPEKDRTSSSQEEHSLTPSLGTRDKANLSQSFSEISSESQDSDICKLVCTKCKSLWGPLEMPCRTTANYVDTVRWNSLCSRCWTKATHVPDPRFNKKICSLGEES